MIIRVMYNDEKYDMVKDYLLDPLIASGKVKKFYRQSEGWVSVTNARVRGMGGAYDGPERRKSLAVTSPVAAYSRA